MNGTERNVLAFRFPKSVLPLHPEQSSKSHDLQIQIVVLYLAQKQTGQPPGKDKEMIRIQKFFSKEYMEHSLCSYYYGVHGPLARPYETILYDRPECP